MSVTKFPNYLVLLAIIGGTVICTRITLFETEDGNRPHQIFVTVKNNECTPLSQAYFPQPTKSIKIHDGADCVRIWESFLCEGHSRCFCEFDQVINLNEFMMTPEKSWGNADTHSVSPCSYPEPVVATITLYKHDNFSGENVIHKLLPNQCDTIYSGDKWSNKISSLSVIQGCVQCFSAENCQGKYETAWNKMVIRNPDGEDAIRSMKPCPIDDQDFETVTEYEMLPVPLPETRRQDGENSCDHAYQYIPVNCTTYYTCVNFTHKELHHCPLRDNLVFNPILGVCDLISNVSDCAALQQGSPMLSSKPAPMRMGNCRSEYRAHKEDCRKFYYCRKVCKNMEQDHAEMECEERECPEGLWWSVDLYGDGSSHQQCTLPTKAICAATDPTVAFSCEGMIDDGNYRNERDCQTFWRCVKGKTFLYNCPRGFVYNPEMNECQLAGKARKFCSIEMDVL